MALLTSGPQAAAILRASMIVVLTCACGSSDASASKDSAGDSIDDFTGRWDTLIRFDWDDDADRTKFAFDERGSGMALSQCSYDVSCEADAWTCESLGETTSSVSGGELHIIWDVSEQGAGAAAEFVLESTGAGELRGSLTVTPCPDDSPECTAAVLACDAGRGLEPDCEGSDYTGLANCQCATRRTCP